MTKPILKWAGNKIKITPTLKENINFDFENYYEPFCGSLGSFLGFDFDKPSYLNDNNKELILVYETLKKDKENVLKILNHLKSDKESFLTIRQNEGISDAEKSARFIYLNKNCFNGLYRVNSKNKFNVPWGGKEREPPYVDERNYYEFAEKIKNTTFFSLNYLDFLAETKENSFIYCDPPYFDTFSGYTKSPWTDQDQTNLLEACIDLQKNKGCSIIISNSLCEKSINLYKGLKTQEIPVFRSISANPQKRGKINEIAVFLFNE